MGVVDNSESSFPELSSENGSAAVSRACAALVKMAALCEGGSTAPSVCSGNQIGTVRRTGSAASPNDDARDIEIVVTVSLVLLRNGLRSSQEAADSDRSSTGGPPRVGREGRGGKSLNCDACMPDGSLG